MNSTITTAINRKNCLELRYHGFSRVVEPYAYGRDKDGEEILRCFQITGGSTSGERTGWKLLKVREVYSLHQDNRAFVVRNEYRRGDKSMEHIFAQL